MYNPNTAEAKKKMAVRKTKERSDLYFPHSVLCNTPFKSQTLPHDWRVYYDEKTVSFDSILIISFSIVLRLTPIKSPNAIIFAINKSRSTGQCIADPQAGIIKTREKTIETAAIAIV